MENTSKHPTSFADFLQPLPYRPTGKLTPTARSTTQFEGWEGREFQDARGNLYERERDGEWERWLLVEWREGPNEEILFRPDLTKSGPDDYYDCLDRINDFEFTARAIVGLIRDSQRRGLFLKGQLERLQGIADQLVDYASALEPALD
jgi:hypothetical protein